VGTASAASTSTTIRYRVRSGETLSELAERYHTTVTRLRSLNAMGSRELLRAGQVIRVPAPAAPAATSRATSPRPATASTGGQTHVVRRGETLSTIARRYGVTLSALRTANGMSEQDVLKAGARLRIP
ncbi:MAG TPA: LysM peptidoglycan-binding domain-containing protein, partial [Gemmatimonadales bacterium]|nr:LysM peptidoglycan-binding domain-containing protein [Gemmatimonadales bacterium]